MESVPSIKRLDRFLRGDVEHMTAVPIEKRSSKWILQHLKWLNVMIRASEFITKQPMVNFRRDIVDAQSVAVFRRYEATFQRRRKYRVLAFLFYYRQAVSVV